MNFRDHVLVQDFVDVLGAVLAIGLRQRVKRLHQRYGCEAAQFSFVCGHQLLTCIKKPDRPRAAGQTPRTVKRRTKNTVAFSWGNGGRISGCDGWCFQVWPDAPEVIGTEVLTCDLPSCCVFNGKAMLNRNWAHSLCPLVHSWGGDLQQSGKRRLRSKQGASSFDWCILCVHTGTIRHCLTTVNRHCLIRPLSG